MTVAIAHDPDLPLAGLAEVVRIASERAQDRAQVDALIDAAFGPGRFAKTAERLREGVRPCLELSFCAWSGGELAGAVRQWPIRIGDARAVFLGPVAVHAGHQGRGVGLALVARACRAAAEAGGRGVLLVGGAAYFQAMGFSPISPERVAMPAPVDPARLLWRPLASDESEPPAGEVRPDP